MRHILTTAAIALSVLASPAHAATFEWWKNAEDSYGLKISGQIVKGDAEQFRHALRDADPYYGSGGASFTIYLESPGGLVVEAIGIGGAIRPYGFNTFVADGTMCASACGMIWLAGERRYLGTHAVVGFHAPYHLKTRQILPEAVAFAKAYLAKLGISQPTIDYLLQAPPEGMEWLTPDKARQHGIETWACMRCTGDAPAAPAGEPLQTIPKPVQTVPIKGDFPPASRLSYQPIGAPAPTIIPASAPIPRSTRAVR